jgi:hypothetical protein
MEKKKEKKVISKEKPVKTDKKESTKKIDKEVSKESSNTPKAYHVVKRESDKKRCVKLAKGEKVIKTFDTKVEAEDYVKVMAKNQGATVRMHASKGKNKGRIQ